MLPPRTTAAAAEPSTGGLGTAAPSGGGLLELDGVVVACGKAQRYRAYEGEGALLGNAPNFVSAGLLLLPTGGTHRWGRRCRGGGGRVLEQGALGHKLGPLGAVDLQAAGGREGVHS